LKLSGVSAPCTYVVNLKLRLASAWTELRETTGRYVCFAASMFGKSVRMYTEIPPGLEPTSRIIVKVKKIAHHDSKLFLLYKEMASIKMNHS